MEASMASAAQRKSVDNVSEATAIITNPTHFAVAIKYEPNENDVPIIIAMGKDAMAFRVIEQAELNSISVVCGCFSTSAGSSKFTNKDN